MDTPSGGAEVQPEDWAHVGMPPEQEHAWKQAASPLWHWDC